MRRRIDYFRLRQSSEAGILKTTDETSEQGRIAALEARVATLEKLVAGLQEIIAQMQAGTAAKPAEKQLRSRGMMDRPRTGR